MNVVERLHININIRQANIDLNIITLNERLRNRNMSPIAPYRQYGRNEDNRSLAGTRTDTVRPAQDTFGVNSRSN